MELFAADGHDAGGCERVTGKSGMRPSRISSKRTSSPRSTDRFFLSATTRVQKVLDRSGIRIGGVLSDIFGLNGRRILDSLVARRPRTDILDSLSRHVRSRLQLLGDALRLTLSETDRLLLADLISGHDDLDRRVQDFDRHIDNAVTDYTAQCRLLETIPGVDHTSACAILSEMGPDPSVFGAASRLAA